MKPQHINQYPFFQDSWNLRGMTVSCALVCDRRADFKYYTDKAQRYKQ